jgi:hypothetical protein
MEDYPFSAVRDCLFSIVKLLSILVADFHPQFEDSPCQGDRDHVMKRAVGYLVAGLLARSQYAEGPATGHLGTGFSWFSFV